MATFRQPEQALRGRKAALMGLRGAVRASDEHTSESQRQRPGGRRPPPPGPHDCLQTQQRQVERGRHMCVAVYLGHVCHMYMCVPGVCCGMELYAHVGHGRS